MWAGGLGLGLAVFLTALAVKTMDDLLDEPEEASAGVGTGTAVAYVALLLVLAGGLAPAATVSLFLAAYAIGMAPGPAGRLPSGLPTWAESLVAIGFAVLVAGPAEALGSMLLVAGVQVFDDFWDYERDRALGLANIGLAVGRWPALTLALIFFAAGLTVSPGKTLAGVAAAGALVAGSGAKPGPDRFPELAWLPRRGDDRRRPGSSRPGSPRFRLAAVGVAAAVLGAAGTAVAAAVSERLPPAGEAAGVCRGTVAGGWGSWPVLAAGALVVLMAAAGTGLLWAYRRGLETGRRRGAEAEKALAVLRARAERLEGPEGD